MDKTAARHLAAINSGQINKTNVIGIRKILNHAWRIEAGYDGNRSNATPDDAARLLAAIHTAQPRVCGDLHHSGFAVLRSPRWRKRWTAKQTDVIATMVYFRLVDFIDVARGHYVPVYEAVSPFGSFRFYNLAWQAAVAYGLESGPMVVS